MSSSCNFSPSSPQLEVAVRAVSLTGAAPALVELALREIAPRQRLMTSDVSASTRRIASLIVEGNIVSLKCEHGGTVPVFDEWLR